MFGLRVLVALVGELRRGDEQARGNSGKRGYDK